MIWPLSVLLIAWLAICTIHDWLWQEVPNRLTLPLLAAAALGRLAGGTWQTPGLIVLLIGTAELSARVQWGRRLRLPVAVALSLLAVCLALPDLELALGLLAIGGVYLVWLLGGMGGADAKLLFALVLLLGAGVLVPITLIGGVQAVITRLISRQKQMPYLIAILGGTLLDLILLYILKSA